MIYEIKRLSEVSNIKMGQSPKSSTYNIKKEGLPFFQGKADFSDVSPIAKKYCSKPLKIADKYSVLLSVRAPVGSVNIAKEICCIGRGLAALSSIKGVTNFKYLFYYLKSKEKELSCSGFGSTFTALCRKDVENIELPVPPIEIQEMIVSALDKAQELIDKRKQQIKLLDRFLQSVFLDMFGDPSRNTKKWDVGVIRNLVSHVSYGSSKKADINKQGYPIIRMNNITYNGKMNLDTLKYIDLQDNELERFLVKKGDILFNRTNSKELVGKTAVFKEEQPMAYAGYLIRIRVNEKANSEFISAYLNSKYGKVVLKNMCKNIVGMANINAQEMQNIQIYIPPIELQNKFAAIVEKTEAQKELMQESLTMMEDNFKSIMQKAFRGELFN